MLMDINTKPDEYRGALENWYEEDMGIKLDLDNPQTYNEKIQWLKLHDSTPIKTKLADKYGVRSWVSEKIGEQYLIPLLGVWNNYDEINFDALPERFVLKCTHGSLFNLIIQDKNEINHISVKNDFESWLNINYAYYGIELQYKDIQPKIIAEEYIENGSDDLYDYKIWCFNGEPKYIQFLCGRKTKLKMAFFDTDWNLLPFVYEYERNTDHVPRPENLNELLRLAKILSQGFVHVRVDFYVLNDGSIKFGEMTFTPASGRAKWVPPKYDFIMGQNITLENAEILKLHVSMPKVSVIIPVFNAELYLEKCLDSVVNQTLKDIEIICVNDGSTDNSLHILNAYAEKDKRIIVIDQPNINAGAARNTGLKITTGEYLAFFDADDFFEPLMLEKMYNKCREDNADICACGFASYDMSTKKISSVFRIILELLPSKMPFSPHDIPKHIFNIFNPAPWNKLFRADFIKKYSIEFQSLKHVNDAFFTHSAFAAAERITVIDQFFINYRTKTSTSISESNSDRTLCIYEAAKGRGEFLKRYGFYDEFKECYLNSVSNYAACSLVLAKSKDMWLNTAIFLKNKFIPDFKLFDYPETMYDKWNYDAMLFLMESSQAELESHNPVLRSDETTALPVDEALTFPFNDTPKIKVSVIIPVYNTELYIEECIRSVLRQSLMDIEIICVDDGSTDDSLKIMRSIAEEDSRIIILTQENQGLPTARNNALAIAKGEYISFLDSDDLLVWCALEHLYRQAKYHSLDDIFCEAHSFYDPVEMYQAYPVYHYMYKYNNSYTEPLNGRDLLSALIENNDYNPSCCMRLFRHEFLTENGISFPIGVLHEDNVFTLHTLNNAKRAWIYKEPLYYRRICPESTMTKTKSLENINGYYSCLLEIEKMILQEESEFKKTLDILKSIYKTSLLEAYNNIQGEDCLKIPEALSLTINLAQKEDELTKKEQELTAQIAELTAQLTHQKNVATEKEQELTAQLTHQKNVVIEKEQELENIYHSRSWKLARIISAPVRAIKKSLL